MATTRGGLLLPCQAAACRTLCTRAVASVPLEQVNGSDFFNLKLGALLPLLLPLMLACLQGWKYHILKLLGESNAAPATCQADICINGVTRES
jgi:hypothetical protein